MTQDKKEVRNLRIFAVGIIIVLTTAMYVVHKYNKNSPTEYHKFNRGTYGN
jgi:hypothetical protein